MAYFKNLKRKQNYLQMKRLLLLIITICLLYSGCGKNETDKTEIKLNSEPDKKETKSDGDKNESNKKFRLMDFFSDDAVLMKRVDEVYDGLNDDERIGQMIVTSGGKNGKPKNEVDNLIKKKIVGGILILGGSAESYSSEISGYKNLAKSSGCLPLIFSADAEPSLINIKISGLAKFPSAQSIKDSEQSSEVAKKISDILIRTGIQQNFAPVCDLAVNTEVIGERAFSKKPEIEEKLASSFIRATQKEGVVATAKHFPGHGYAYGDSHKNLVAIDGELKELDQFKYAINKDSIISVMIGHIAVKNNSRYGTDGYPATLSRKIVTNLLKDELKFKGIIITDALNMGALNKFEKPSFNAIKSGVDMVLMPKNETALIELVKNEMKNNNDFKNQITASVKKIIKLKICLNLI